MKIGIYISGLGQSFVDESVEKYAERLKNEISFSTNGIGYELKKEKINYSQGRDSTIVSICEKNQQGKVVYKIYDFKYNGILTEKFKSFSLIFKNLWLFLLVVRKFRILITRLFKPAGYNRTGQTLYLFMIFMIIACAVLLMLPATLAVIARISENNAIISAIQQRFPILINIPFISKQGIETFSKVIVSLTALLLLILPNANVLITSLATEFVCANDYIQFGIQRQLIQGNLELLIEYITENEKDCKIHFHTYSFGSIIAIDYIYPFNNKVSKNAEKFCEAIITIGTPFEFVKSYYPQFYQNRRKKLGDKLYWINVYSIADAFATNFRNDAKIGNAQFGIDIESNKPINVNYEFSSLNRSGILDTLLLYSIKVHGMYWDANTEGKSCIGLIYNEMNKRQLI